MGVWAILLRQYAKQAGESLENQNMIAEIKLRAERRAGELIKEMPKNVGAQGKIQEHLSGADIVSEPVYQPPTLAELGISHKESSRFQAVASIPEEVFEAEIIEALAPAHAWVYRLGNMLQPSPLTRARVGVSPELTANNSQIERGMPRARVGLSLYRYNSGIIGIWISLELLRGGVIRAMLGLWANVRLTRQGKYKRIARRQC